MIMGAGKTQAAITYMNENVDRNFVFITPYLAEVERIKQSCENRSFYSPQNFGDGKLGGLHTLLGQQKNIASTHALFKTYNEQTVELIKNGRYTLILDEVCDVIFSLTIHKHDIKLLLDDNIISVKDDVVHWVDDNYEGDFIYFRDYAKNGNLISYEDKMLLWTFPSEIFKAFDDVIILTYLFEAQTQRCYFDANSVQYNYIGVKNENNIYRFTETVHNPDYVKNLKRLVHVVDDKKLNQIGDYKYALSVSWFEREFVKNQHPKLKVLKNNIVNLYINKYKVPSAKTMWTTYKKFKSTLSGKGYKSGFLSYNARATNEYRKRTHLAFCANIYFNPYLKNYFIKHNVNIDEDLFALSEMLQWIWRSAIRDEKEVWIYVPSRRMRELLVNWLDKMSE